MTGYTVHTGSNQKFVAGWDHIFQGAGSPKKGTSTSGAVKKKASSPTKAAKPKAGTRKVVAKKSKRSK
jgi:hypothetical protein